MDFQRALLGRRSFRSKSCLTVFGSGLNLNLGWKGSFFKSGRILKFGRAWKRVFIELCRENSLNLH